MTNDGKKMEIRFFLSNLEENLNKIVHWIIHCDKCVLGILFLAGSYMFASGGLSAEEFKILKNFDLPGKDIRTPAQDSNLSKISFDDCQAVCRATVGCKAFTYNKKVKRCFLKSGMSPPKSYKGAISGVRVSLSKVSKSKNIEELKMAAPEPSPARSQNKVAKAEIKPAVKNKQKPDRNKITVQASQIPIKQKQAMKVATEPLVKTNSDAKLIYQNLAKGRKLADLAANISARYLKAYDNEQGGIRWVSTKSVGISVPISTTKSQAKALVLNKMGKSHKLRWAQDQLDKLEVQGSKLLTVVLKHFKPDIQKRITQLHQEKVRAGAEFKVARDALQAHGDRLNHQADKSWKLPSGAPLAKLHALAADMRIKRLEAIRTGKEFSEALKSALETPEAVLVL